ncbi:MAG: FecR domain-containing protein [Oceanicaulis sp.]|nr:FecR domain-containing protein [Oceanicaulis sp.]
MNPSHRNTSRTPDRDIELSRSALHWAERMTGGLHDDESLMALNAWLNADPAHQDAYARAVMALRASGEISQDPRILAMRESALAARCSRNDWVHRAMAGCAAIITVSIAVLMVAVLGGPNDEFQDNVAQNETTRETQSIRTSVGEQKVIELVDNTVITLNTDSLIYVRYSDQERRIIMGRGQAHFDIAHDAARPFRVRAGNQVITALGTAFDVRLEDESVSVLLVEGLVEVEHYHHPTPNAAERSASEPPVTLMAGEQITVRNRSSERTVSVVEIDRATSWRSGRIIFEDEAIPDAVREVNRYLTQPIQIRGDLTQLRVSGVFRTGQSDSFLSALEAEMPVYVTRENDYIFISLSDY